CCELAASRERASESPTSWTMSWIAGTWSLCATITESRLAASLRISSAHSAVGSTPVYPCRPRRTRSASGDASRRVVVCVPVAVVMSAPPDLFVRDEYHPPRFRLTIENMSKCNTGHVVLVVVAQARPVPESSAPVLHVLLWQHALGAQAGRWALPGGTVRDDEDLATSATRQLAEKVDVRTVSHLESVAEFSDPHRVPRCREFASGFLGLLPCDTDPAIPDDTAWFRVHELPDTDYDHAEIVARSRARLAAKLSYSTLGFALAPEEFPLSELAQLYAAALGHPVDPTNLQRVLTRRGELVRCGRSAPPGPTGGRPAALYRFAERRLRITDQFAALRPPAQRGGAG